MASSASASVVEEWEREEWRQRLFELSARVEELGVELEASESARSAAKTSLGQAEKEAASRRAALTDLQGSVGKLQLSLDASQRGLRLAEDEKDALNLLLASRQESLAELSSELTRLKEELDRRTGEKIAAVVALEEERGAKAKAEFLEKRLAEQRRTLEEESGWLRKEKEAAESRLRSVREEARAKEYEASTALADAHDAAGQAQRSLEDAREREAALTTQLHDLNSRLRAKEAEAAENQAEYEKELDCQRKLIAVLRTGAEEAEAKVEELSGTLEKVSEVYEASKQEVLQARAETDEVRKEAGQELADAQAEIARLKEELDKASELLRSKHRVMLTDEEVAALSPGAAAASQLIRGQKSITSIYRDHARVVEELEASRGETRRLETYIHEIVNDIQAKAPKLREQRVQYEAMADANKGLQQQLAEAAAEQTALSQRADATLRELKYTKAELERFQRDNADISTQLRQLLAWAEAVRTGSASMDEPLGDATASSVYRSIEELQALNQRLMSQLGEAESKREELIKAAEEEKVGKLQADLDRALGDLATLQNHRNQHQTIIQSLQHQRDEMERLYQAEKAKVGLGPVSSALPSPVQKQNSVEAGGQLERTEKEFTIYRHEKAEKDKLLEEKITGLEKRVHQLSTTNAKLAADLEYADERFKVLEKNTGMYKREAERGRETTTRLREEGARQQAKVAELTARLLDLQDVVARERTDARVAKDSLERSRAREAELGASLAALQTAEHSQRSLVASMEELRHGLQKADAQRHAAAQQELDALRRDKKTLADALASAHEKHRDLALATRRQSDELRTALAATEVSAKAAMERADNAEKDAKDGEERLATLAMELEEMRTAAKDGSSDRFQKEAHQLQTRFNYLELQFREKVLHLEKTTEELAQTKKKLGELESMSVSMEETIRREKDTGEVVSGQMKAELDSVRAARDAALQKQGEVQRELDVLRHANEDLQSRLDALQSAGDAQAERLTAAVADKDSQLQAALEREAKARADRANLDDSLAQSQAKLTEAQENLASLTDKVAALTKSLEEKEALVRTMSQEAEAWEKEVKEVNATNEQLKETMSGLNSDFQARLATLQATNESLSQKTVELGRIAASYEETAKAAAPAGSEAPTGDGDATAAGGEDKAELSEKSVGALMEVMGHLRSEKERAEEREALAKEETEKLSSRVRLLEEECKASRAETQRREELEASLAEASQEKVRLVSQLEALSELEKVRETLATELGALGREKQGLEERLTTLETERSELSSTRLSLESQVGRLGGELEAAAAEGRKWKTRYDELVEQRAGVESAELAQLRRELQDKEARLLSGIDELKKLSAKEAEARAQAALHAKTAERLDGEIADANSKAKDLEERLTAAEQDSAKTNKTLDQARQLAIKYKKLYQGEAAKAAAAPKAGEGNEATASLSQEAVAEAAAKDATIAQLEEQLKAAQTENADLKAKLDEAEGYAETKTKLDALTSQTQKFREASALAGQKLAAEAIIKKKLETELAQSRDRIAELEKLEGELRETRTRMKAMERRQLAAKAEAPASSAQEEVPVPPVSAPTPPVVQPVVPQPQPPQQPSESSAGPSPPVTAFGRRFGRQVASVQPSQPSSGRRQQALVPPSSVSPGPALPDQSSSSVPSSSQAAPTTTTHATVSPIHMAVSTTAAFPAHPVPQAVVPPHPSAGSSQPSSEISSGIVSAGPGSASSSNLQMAGSSDSSTARKRAQPPAASSSSQAASKRQRTEAEEQVSTSEPVLPFSTEPSGAASSGAGGSGEVQPPAEAMVDQLLEGEGEADDDEDQEDQPLPSQEEENDSSDDDIGLGGPDDVQINVGDELVDEPGDSEDEADDDEDPSYAVESTASDPEMEAEEGGSPGSDDDDDIQILDAQDPLDTSFGRGGGGVESSGEAGEEENLNEGMGEESLGDVGDAGEELPTGEAIMAGSGNGIVPQSALGGGGKAWSGAGWKVPQSSGEEQLRSGSPPDEGIESDSACASSTSGLLPSSSFLPNPESQAPSGGQGSGEAASSSQGSAQPPAPGSGAEAKPIRLRKPIVWNEPSAAGPPELPEAQQAGPSGLQPPVRPAAKPGQQARKTLPPALAKKRGAFRGGAFRKQ